MSGERVIHGLRNLPASVEIDFLFAPHSTAEDLFELPDRFADCDIYIPETGPVINGLGTIYRQISEGDQTALENETRRLQRFANWEGPVYTIGQIFDSRKSIGIIDVPSTSPLWRSIGLGMMAIAKAGISDEQLVQSYIELGSMQRRREDYMLQALAPTIRRAIQEEPMLLQKTSIKTLLTLGPLHTRMYQEALRALGSQRVNRTMPGSMPPDISIIRRGVFNLGTTVEDAYAEIARHEKHGS